MADSFDGAAAISPEAAAVVNAVSVPAAEPLGPDYAPSREERMALHRAMIQLMAVVSPQDAWSAKSN